MSYEALKISHTFSMDDSGAQACLKHENMLVPVQKHCTCLPLDITVFGGAQVNVYEL